ncbi:MAG: hypothetical protein U9R16_04375 [Campylobacterota bacterium]|nr:hypothetical protein [Campylobacterota bacterium]
MDSKELSQHLREEKLEFERKKESLNELKGKLNNFLKYVESNFSEELYVEIKEKIIPIISNIDKQMGSFLWATFADEGINKDTTDFLEKVKENLIKIKKAGVKKDISFEEKAKQTKMLLEESRKKFDANPNISDELKREKKEFFENARKRFDEIS